MSREVEKDALIPGQGCPMSGVVTSFPNGDEWVNEAGTCWKCGGSTRLRVRGTDLFPYARCLAHKVPKTYVTPPADD